VRAQTFAAALTYVRSRTVGLCWITRDGHDHKTRILLMAD
jgi:hypothetical protein